MYISVSDSSRGEVTDVKVCFYALSFGSYKNLLYILYIILHPSLSEKENSYHSNKKGLKWIILKLKSGYDEKFYIEEEFF